MGTAGVGKTSLAVRWSHRVRQEFPDGQLFVNLRGYDPGQPVTAHQALERFLTAFGLPAAGLPGDTEERSALLRTLLARRRMLIVLDNAATVGQVRPLLPGAGRCLTLVTSRSRLSGLVARDGARRITLEVFAEPEAVQLVQATVAGYRSGDDAGEIAELAQLCARLPLALRIAAERAAVRPFMPLGELIDTLRDESHLWDALSTEDDDEADAVRTVFAWSYRALAPEVARMFRLLGLHPGPEFSTHTAAALAAIEPVAARRLLDVLVGAHLLAQIGPDRYQFHDLLRAYATDQVRHEETPEECDAAVTRMLVCYLYTAHRCAATLDMIDDTLESVRLDELDEGVRLHDFSGPEEALAWFQAEGQNLAAAVREASVSGRDRLAWQIAAVVREIYPYTHAFDGWFSTSEIGLQAARRGRDSQGEAFLLESLATAYRQNGRFSEAERYGQAALDCNRRIGNRFGEARALNMLGIIASDIHQLSQSHAYLDQAESLCRDNGFDKLYATILGNHAVAYNLGGQYRDGYAAEIQALELSRTLEMRHTEWESYISLAIAAHGLGEYDKATAWITKALTVVRRSGSPVTEAGALTHLGYIQRGAGDPAAALVSLQQAVSLHRRFGSRRWEAWTLDETGTTYHRLGRLKEAADFHRHAADLYRTLGIAWGRAVALDHLAQALRDNGSPDQATSCWREALPLLDGFDDIAAQTLRHTIQSALNPPPPAT